MERRVYKMSDRVQYKFGIGALALIPFSFTFRCFMVALCNRADHYIFMLWFVVVVVLLLLFFLA